MNVKVVGVGRKWLEKDILGSDRVLLSSWFLKSGKEEVWREEGQLDRVSSVYRGSRPNDGGRPYLRMGTSLMKGVEMDEHVKLREEQSHILKNLKALQQEIQ